MFGRRNFSCLLLALMLMGALALPMRATPLQGQARLVQQESTLENRTKGVVQDHVQDAVLNWPTAQGATIDVKVLTNAVTLDNILPQGVSVDDINVTSSLSDRYSERSVVRVAFHLKDGQVREMGVPVFITISKPVWVVASMIRANQPIEKAQLKLETRDVSHQLLHSVGPETPVTDFIARMNILPGEVLDDRKIIIPPDVRANTDVNIVLTNNRDMRINVPGVAMADGRIGETIRVRQQLFKTRYYMAKIINKNQVLVEI